MPTETLSLATYDGTDAAAAGPYGTVTLQQIGDNVQVSVSLQSPSVGFVDSGAGNALMFDLSGDAGITATDLTPGFAFASTLPGDIHADGSGTWDFAISCAGGACGSGGSSPAAGPLSFTLDNVTLYDFVQNDNHNYFASDLCIGVSRTGCGVTGDVVATSRVLDLPEPPSLALFAAGLTGLFLFGRRNKARKI